MKKLIAGKLENNDILKNNFINSKINDLNIDNYYNKNKIE
jgi:hypothetical protein